MHHDDDDDHDDRRQALALCRYQIISPYIALDPPRGQRGKVLAELAVKTWLRPDGAPFHVAAETIRGWVRRYRLGGLDGLKDKARVQRGIQVLSPEQVELVIALNENGSLWSAQDQAAFCGGADQAAGILGEENQLGCIPTERNGIECEEIDSATREGREKSVRFTGPILDIGVEVLDGADGHAHLCPPVSYADK